jgi:mycothiol synthase
MDYTLPPNYTMRTCTLDDAQMVLDLKNHCSLLSIGEADETLDDVLTDWQAPDMTLATDTRVVLTPQGRIVGYAEVDSERPMTPMFDVYVHHDHEATTVGEYLLAWCEERARSSAEQVEAHIRIALRGYSFREDARYYQPLLVRMGFQPIRHAFHMKLELTEAPLPPDWPPGITLRKAVAGQDERTVFAVYRETFRDHFGYVEQEFEKEVEGWLHEWDGYDRDLWYMAYAGETLVGVCLCKPDRFGDPDYGWVSVLGVMREHRRAGLGRALLLHAFHELRQQGKRCVGLGVDASSLTGAVDLYLKAGMSVSRRFDLYEKELRPGVDVTAH